MPFITPTDYNSIIKPEQLVQLTQGNNTILQEAQEVAMHEMASYLSSRYDVEIIYSKEGTERHPLILFYAMDLVLYHLHARIDPIKVPEHRKERYRHAVESLQRIADGIQNPFNLPPLQDPQGDNESGNRYGSDTMRTEQW